MRLHTARMGSRTNQSQSSRTPGFCRILNGLTLALLAALAPAGAARAQQPGPEASRRAVFDQLLDLNVRDGLVYYRALKAERGGLDRYVAALADEPVESLERNAQVAFWINAYNAIVLRTVADHYPIPGRAHAYPARSIRQIPGAFERTRHRVAGRSLTLDEIEQVVLAAFRDPRVFLALGRGALGGGRLRSEAYTAANLDRQLAEVASECLSRSQCIQLDRSEVSMRISSIFSWRRNEFIEAYAGGASQLFDSRSPIERAVLAFVDPRLLAAEREFLKQNQFKIEYLPFDWSLNDLTGRGGR